MKLQRCSARGFVNSSGARTHGSEVSRYENSQIASLRSGKSRETLRRAREERSTQATTVSLIPRLIFVSDPLPRPKQFLQSKTQGTQSTKQAAALLKPTKVNMNTLSTPPTKEEKHAHNEIAAVLSIMPGLGHIYKGHYEMGFLWMFLGMPVALFIGIISILGTAGVGLLLPIGCWAALAYDAYNEKDRRHHHHLTWDGDDESPD